MNACSFGSAGLCLWFVVALAAPAFAAPGAGARAVVPPIPTGAVDPDQPSDEHCKSPPKVVDDGSDTGYTVAVTRAALSKERCALHKAYVRTRSTLATKPEVLAKLDAAQERWRAYRDAQMVERFPRLDDDGGHYYGTVIAACLSDEPASLTRLRARELTKVTGCRSPAAPPAPTRAKLKAAEEELAVVLRAVQAAYPAETKLLTAIKSGHKRWQALRDAHAELAAALSGNDDSRCVHNERERLTRERTARLRQWLTQAPPGEEHDPCLGSVHDGLKIDFAAQKALVGERTREAAVARKSARTTRSALARLVARERVNARGLSALDAELERHAQKAAAARAQLKQTSPAPSIAVAKRAAAAELAAFRAIASKAQKLEQHSTARKATREEIDRALEQLAALSKQAAGAASAAQVAVDGVRGWPKAPTANAAVKDAAFAAQEMQAASKLLGLEPAAFRAQSAELEAKNNARRKTIAAAQTKVDELTGKTAKQIAANEPSATAPAMTSDPKLAAAEPGTCDVRHLDWRNMEYPWPSRASVRLRDGKSSAAYGKGKLTVALERLHFGTLKGAKGAVAFAKLTATYKQGSTQDTTKLLYVFEDAGRPRCSLMIKSLFQGVVSNERFTESGLEYEGEKGKKVKWQRPTSGGSPADWHVMSSIEGGCDVKKIDWCSLDAKGKRVKRPTKYTRDGDHYATYCSVSRASDSNRNWQPDTQIEIGEEMLKPDDMDEEEWGSYFGNQGSPFNSVEGFCLELDARCRPVPCEIGPAVKAPSDAATKAAKPGKRLSDADLRSGKAVKLVPLPPEEVLRRWGEWLDPAYAEPEAEWRYWFYRPSEAPAEFVTAVQALYPEFHPLEIMGPGRPSVYGRLPDGREVFVVAACTAHDCGDNEHAIVYEIAKKRASMVRSIIDPKKGYGDGGYALYGQPDATIKGMLFSLVREEFLQTD